MESHASSPRDADMVMLKRVVRFLIKRPITWTHYRWEVRSDHIMSWTTNREDRRSVSGGMLVHSGGLLRFWSIRQKAVLLLSWESELYAAVSIGVEALGPRCGLRDFGNDTRVTIACDNQGVVDHTARRGLGLAKHFHTRHLWLQAARDDGQLDVKTPTQRHLFDLLTGPLPFDRIQELCKLVGIEYDQDSKTLGVQCPSTRCPRT